MELQNEIPEELTEINIDFKIHWKEIDGKYVSATGLYAGKILIASYCYNGLRQKGADNEDYAVSSSMPGIKSNLGKYATEEECQKRCYQVAETFLKMLQHKN